MTIAESDLGWLAGMLDGEGNMSAGTKIDKEGREYLGVKVRMSGTDIRMMHHVGSLYQQMNLTFFNSLMNKNRQDWKTGINVEVASQASVKKLLTAVLPFLRGKAKVAQAMIDMIDYVQSVRNRNGNVRSCYAEHEDFKQLMLKYREEMNWYYDPSTTTRRAREPISLDGIV